MFHYKTSPEVMYQTHLQYFDVSSYSEIKTLSQEKTAFVAIFIPYT